LEYYDQDIPRTLPCEQDIRVMAADLLGLFAAHGLTPKKKAAGEWAAPCPACGGRDRCMIRPDDHDGRGGYWCRQCGTYGDAIQFLRDYEGMSYADACRELGVEAVRARTGLPRPPRPAAGQDPFEPAPSAPPAELWTRKATAFAGWAHAQLLQNPEQLAWLAARGLPLEAIKRYRLGWNPGERGKSCLIRPRANWGLPPAEGKPDKDGRPTVKRTFWIPRGVVIPLLAPDAPEGPVLRLRIRRPEGDRETFKKDTKYYVLPGSCMDAMLLGREARAFVVVESELDALMLHHQVGDLIGVVSVQTANVKKIATGVLETLGEALCILVALDAEGKDGAGAKGWQRWPATFPRAKRWPCPVGKDPGEAYAAGANLRAWIMAGLPPVLQPGRLPPGQPLAAEGEEEKTRAVGAGEATGEKPADGPEQETASSPHGDAATMAAPDRTAEVPWLVPGYVSALDMVPLGKLLSAMRRHDVKPVLVPGLAEQTDGALALWSGAAIAAEVMARMAKLFFGDCLEAILWFLDRRRLRATASLRRVHGQVDGSGEWAALVRRASNETPGLAFAGWTNLHYWREREAAGR